MIEWLFDILFYKAGPRVEIKSRQESVRRGETAVLRCDAEGDAPLDIAWRNRAGRIEPIYDLRFVPSTNSSFN